MKICYLADAADIHTQKWAKYFADKGLKERFFNDKIINIFRGS